MRLNRAITEFDFQTFLNENNVYTTNRNISQELCGICPFCNWKRVSFYVDSVKGLWYCHQCHKKGGAVQLIQQILECSYAAAVERLTDNFTIFVHDDEELQEVTVPEITLPEEFHSLSSTHGDMSYVYREYAYGRGIDDNMLLAYNIGFCISGRYAHRLIVPVYHFGKLVSFVARAVYPIMSAKVDTPPFNDQSRYCFNLENIWGVKEVVVTEGVFDALTMPDRAVATFGKAITPAQCNLLRKSGAKTLLFCYDNDALQEALDFAENNWLSFQTKVVVLPEGQDPSDVGKDVIGIFVDRAIRVTPGMTLEQLQERWYNEYRTR